MYTLYMYMKVLWPVTLCVYVFVHMWIYMYFKLYKELYKELFNYFKQIEACMEIP